MVQSHNKGFIAPLAILIIVLVIAVVAGGIIWWKYTAMNQTSVVPTAPTLSATSSISVSPSSNVLSSNKNLATDVCIYDNNKYITCGSDYVLVSKGKEYNIVANKAFYFPQGEKTLVGLIYKPPTGNQKKFFLYLKEGEYQVNEITSRKAVGSFMVGQ